MMQGLMDETGHHSAHGVTDEILLFGFLFTSAELYLFGNECTRCTYEYTGSGETSFSSPRSAVIEKGSVMLAEGIAPDVICFLSVL
jgi:hypothetical protein